MAKLRSVGNSQKFVQGNAETWGEANSFDVVTCFFGTHEMPREARSRVLRNALRIARKKVIFVDIDPTYEPSEAMLAGEPYILEYLKNIDYDFRRATK
jgi:ubiquinone/menaquinone biosynthesis C-methylase UbiE